MRVNVSANCKPPIKPTTCQSVYRHEPVAPRRVRIALKPSSLRRLGQADVRQLLRGGASREQIISELEANHRQRRRPRSRAFPNMRSITVNGLSIPTCPSGQKLRLPAWRHGSAIRSARRRKSSRSPPVAAVLYEDH